MDCWKSITKYMYIKGRQFINMACSVMILIPTLNNNMNIKFIPRTVSIDKHYQKRLLLYRTHLTTELGKSARTFQWSFDKFQLWVYENSRIWHVFNFRKWVKMITYNYSFYPRGQKTCSECEYSKIEKRVFNGCCCVLCINHESSTMC